MNHHIGILLRDLVKVVDRGIDFSDPSRLFARGLRNAADVGIDFLNLISDGAKRLADSVHECNPARYVA